MEKHQPEVMEDVRNTRYEEMEELEPYHLKAKEKEAIARKNLYQKRVAI